MKPENQLTREGNVVADKYSALRNAIPEYSLCKKCKHATDFCEKFYKRFEILNGYKNVTRCQGYEFSFSFPLTDKT
jgi:hypothetical protein